MTTLLGSLVAQVRPDDMTEVVLAFTATLGTDVSRVIVCNTTSTAADFRVWHRPAAETGDPTLANALWYDQEVAAGTSYLGSENMNILMRGGDRLFVQTGTDNALTFSFYGATALPPPARENTRTR